MPTSVLALVRHTPDIEPPDLDDVCAERERLEHVRARAHTRVEDNRHLYVHLTFSDAFKQAER